MFTLGIASDGYLSKKAKTLAIASSGYLDLIVKINNTIRNKGGGEGQSAAQIILNELKLRKGQLQIEDDEILNILKMFLQCQP